MNAFKTEWGKSWMTVPQDNIISHILLPKMRIFRPSYETKNQPVYMNFLLGWEYARIWQKERNEFVQQRLKQEKRKFIKNNYEKWLDKRKPKSRKCA